MLASQEPRNGDFVAYIEQLQRESAARIRAKAQVPMVELAATPRAGGARAATIARTAPMNVAERGAMSGARAEPVLNRQQADALVARLSRSNARGRSAAVLLSIGAALALSALMFDGGPVMLLIGVGLIVWSIARLHALSRAPDDPASGPGAAADRARIAQVFGRPPQQ